MNELELLSGADDRTFTIITSMFDRIRSMVSEAVDEMHEEQKSLESITPIYEVFAVMICRLRVVVSTKTVFHPEVSTKTPRCTVVWNSALRSSIMQILVGKLCMETVLSPRLRTSTRSISTENPKKALREGVVTTPSHP